MAAATTASEAAERVALVDDNPALGGQVWRAEKAQLSQWSTRLRTRRIDLLCGATVFHIDVPSRTLYAETQIGLLKLRYSQLILATGAREVFLPFPGWTLPNVMAAGGLQAMVKSGLPIAGKRVVVAGTGPLLLAVAALLRDHGARVQAVCDQASWSALGRFALAARRQPTKSTQALALLRKLAGVRFRANSWPVRALGQERLGAIVISFNGRPHEVACDYLACGFHLVPNIELASLCGCRIEAGFVAVDERQQTSVSGIFCAGEPTGIGGLEKSLLEGRIAALCATGRAEQAAKSARSHALCAFEQALQSAFVLRPELRSLPEPDTIVCRCEDVPHSALAAQTSWRAAKLQTRCGMGACQGRVCGPATQFLYGWQPDSVRPPIFPARLENLAALQPDLVE